MTAYLLERALVGDPVDAVVADDVVVEVVDGRFAAVAPVARWTAAGGAPSSLRRLPGLTVPGLANAHSHVFHRALRGRTQRGGGSFWTWREQMYELAGRLDPDGLHALARAAYAEMVAAGITTVGEFHYLHHAPDGRPYADPNALGHAVVAAAREVGLRITLLDTCYLSAGFGAPVEGAQRRFSDGDVVAWADRVSRLDLPEHARRGAAIHSVRAVPADQLAGVVAAAEGVPLHVHVSEQRAENEACLAATGRTPTALLDDAGALGPRTTAVHATHLTGDDVARLGRTRTHACFCPTTERDLGDGLGPSLALREAGAPLTLGSDSHAVVDLFEEMRGVELHERLAREKRGHWPAGGLLEAATGAGHASLGWDDAGRLEVGARADLVVLDPASPRTAGTGADAQTVVWAATAADVIAVMSDGVWRDIDPAAVGRRLDEVVRRLLP